MLHNTWDVSTFCHIAIAVATRCSKIHLGVIIRRRQFYWRYYTNFV